ncbi:hypothetical protein DAPPUDRAFT_106222 [Daphnia pulex]|uniref:Uncharacterized protein n=1 Tax=Daphnia pulex TaxID=6669 RepID=E9GSY3_DAPPU|nr:hypothetical protein DAPPUDRAFT_106222 [Daphnia pulex]|eukprot:EFX77270.1 hypothetical protein DAPPUDRAFT_106222 [Daphnia pulex]
MYVVGDCEIGFPVILGMDTLLALGMQIIVNEARRMNPLYPNPGENWPILSTGLTMSLASPEWFQESTDAVAIDYKGPLGNRLQSTTGSRKQPSTSWHADSATPESAPSQPRPALTQLQTNLEGSDQPDEMLTRRSRQIQTAAPPPPFSLSALRSPSRHLLSFTPVYLTSNTYSLAPQVPSHYSSCKPCLTYIAAGSASSLHLFDFVLQKLQEHDGVHRGRSLFSKLGIGNLPDGPFAASTGSRVHVRLPGSYG